MQLIDTHQHLILRDRPRYGWTDGNPAPGGAFTGSVAQNPVRDSSRESSMVAWLYEQTDTPRLQDQELAGRQRAIDAPLAP